MFIPLYVRIAELFHRSRFMRWIDPERWFPLLALLVLQLALPAVALVKYALWLGYEWPDVKLFLFLTLPIIILLGVRCYSLHYAVLKRAARFPRVRRAGVLGVTLLILSNTLSLVVIDHADSTRKADQIQDYKPYLDQLDRKEMTTE